MGESGDAEGNLVAAHPRDACKKSTDLEEALGVSCPVCHGRQYVGALYDLKSGGALPCHTCLGSGCQHIQASSFERARCACCLGTGWSSDEPEVPPS